MKYCYSVIRTRFGRFETGRRIVSRDDLTRYGGWNSLEVGPRPAPASCASSVSTSLSHLVCPFSLGTTAKPARPGHAQSQIFTYPHDGYLLFVHTCDVPTAEAEITYVSLLGEVRLYLTNRDVIAEEPKKE